MISRVDQGGRARQKGWAELGKFLGRELVSLEDASRKRLLAVWEAIRGAERDLDDVLVIGLVGGTGVGKSTLINALAGDAISTSGDRRPTTDRVIAYRHERTLLPSLLPHTDIAEPQRIHRSAPLERVVVLDFPDFDSVERTHNAVLERYFSHLDVLIVLVDDVKYGDARLFDLLGGLPQSHENRHIVLNKIDSLRSRYPDSWEEVVRKILADLRGKLRQHARLDLAENHFMALSALVAYESRVANGPENRHSDGAAGAFDRFIELLEAYQAERRRRAAKEMNIGARQRALLSDVYETSGVERHAPRVESAARLIGEKRHDLRRSIAVLSGTVLSAEERRALASERLGQSAQAFGFPIDFLLTLKAQLPWRRKRRRARSSVQSAGGLSTARLRRHFRAYLEAVQNALRDLRLEVGDAIPVARGKGQAAAPSTHVGKGLRVCEAPGEGQGLFLAPVRELQRHLSDWEAKFERRWSIWNHLLPLLVASGFFLSVTQPALEAGVEQWAADGQIAWGEMGKELLLSLVGALSPVFLLSTVIMIVLAYGVTAIVAWTRQIQRLERVFRRAEMNAGEVVRSDGDGQLQEFENETTAWLDERDELERLVGTGLLEEEPRTAAAETVEERSETV